MEVMFTPAQRARTLRKRSTPAEQLLWDALRNRKLAGEKFRRQYPVGNYVVDFACFERKIIVELDGAGHSPQRDDIRSNELSKKGWRLIRFLNEEVQDHLEIVLTELAMALKGDVLSREIQIPRSAPLRLNPPIRVPSPSGRGTG